MFESLVTIFWVKSYNFLKIDPNLFLQHFNSKIIVNFVKIGGYIKRNDHKFFSTPLLLLFWDPRSGTYPG